MSSQIHRYDAVGCPIPHRTSAEILKSLEEGVRKAREHAVCMKRLDQRQLADEGVRRYCDVTDRIVRDLGELADRGALVEMRTFFEAEIAGRP